MKLTCDEARRIWREKTLLRLDHTGTETRFEILKMIETEIKRVLDGPPENSLAQIDLGTQMNPKYNRNDVDWVKDYLRVHGYQTNISEFFPTGVVTLTIYGW